MSWRDQPRDRRGRWTKTGGGVVAAVLALAVAAGGAGASAGAGIAGGASGSGSAAGRSVGGSQGSGARVRARAKSTARAVQRLRARGLRVTERGVDADDDCVTHSYGQVRQFFREHPCTALYRALLEVRDGQVRILVAVAWVDMPDASQAQQLKQLVDRPGTGNLTELSKEGRRPTSVQWTGEHYASVQDDSTIVNAQAEPIGRTARAVRVA